MVNKKVAFFLICVLSSRFLSATEDSTIQKYQKILAKDPINVVALLHLAHTFMQNKQYNEAEIHYKKALRINPNNTQALLGLGKTLRVQSNLEEAKKYLVRVIEIDPNIADAHIILGKLFLVQKDYENAISHYEEAVALKPKNIRLKFELGNLLAIVGRCQESADQYLDIVKLCPNHYQAMHNAGYSLKVKGDIEKAIELYNRAIELKPDYEEAIYARGLVYLSSGNFKKGWEGFSWRLKKEKRNAEKLRTWIKNNDLQGKTIYLIPEGGLGDTIQFIRYAEELKKRGATVIVSVQKPLKALISNCDYIDLLITPGQKTRKSYHDFSGILSLAAIFESDEETIPKNIPYIFPDKDLTEQWGNYFADKKGLNVGICWEADLVNESRRLLVAHRSIPLKKLAHLSQVKNVNFYSLQKSKGVSQIQDLPSDFAVNTFENLDENHGAFMDTAAIMKHLDLVITVDTAIAHLAGALGVPVFLMLPYNTDWRWILNRTDTPWYPAMKIFKQPAPFDWDSVVESVKKAVQQFEEDKKRSI